MISSPALLNNFLGYGNPFQDIFSDIELDWYLLIRFWIKEESLLAKILVTILKELLSNVINLNISYVS